MSIEPSGERMSRRRNEQLRAFSDEERDLLNQIARSRSDPASHVARAKMLLAVAEGQTYQQAAWRAGRKASDPVSRLVSRFNQEGLSALAPRHGGGAQILYGSEERERILAEFRRMPDREQDGTAIWSLSTLQKALRQAADGLPNISIYTIWTVLHKAGLSWQQSRTWCETGQVKRKRKAGVVTVTDPDAEQKKT
jgi:transposase